MTNYRRAWQPGGTYFFTVALADRSKTTLVDYVERLRQVTRNVRTKHPFQIEAMVVLPDHLHAIWRLPRDDADFATRWSLIKAGFSRGLPVIEKRSNSQKAKRERGIWQRRYWEHLIRDEADLAQHIDYIHYNPVKHGYVKRAIEWPYSSFRRFVRAGWCNEDWAADTPVQTMEIE